jgi:isopentenyldiphosphate isomerase
MEEDELLDLVDKNDRFIGTVMREMHHDNLQEYSKKGQYFKGAVCFLINSSNEVWIPTRQPFKKIAPNCLDYSMAEHVQSGEEYIEAAIRGLKEELFLSVSPKELKLVGRKIVQDFGSMITVFLYKTDRTPSFSENDYTEGRWMSIDELGGLIEKGVPHKSGLVHGLAMLREYLDE